MARLDRAIVQRAPLARPARTGSVETTPRARTARTPPPASPSPSPPSPYPSWHGSTVPSSTRTAGSTSPASVETTPPRANSPNATSRIPAIPIPIPVMARLDRAIVQRAPLARPVPPASKRRPARELPERHLPRPASPSPPPSPYPSWHGSTVPSSNAHRWLDQPRQRRNDAPRANSPNATSRVPVPAIPIPVMARLDRAIVQRAPLARPAPPASKRRPARNSNRFHSCLDHAPQYQVSRAPPHGLRARTGPLMTPGAALSRTLPPRPMSATFGDKINWMETDGQHGLG